MRRLFCLCLLLLLLPGQAHADETLFQSGPKQVALLELFTSEGCSSCPPAERWLGTFKNHPALWEKIVPIAWHVTYWDRLGWKDPYASNRNTARQYAYAKQWKSPSVYTPGFALNGREWKRGESIGNISPDAGRLSVRWNADQRVEVTYQLPSETQTESYHVMIALLGSGIVSDVRKGENAGRELHHEFVVLQNKAAKLLRHGTHTHTITVRFPDLTGSKIPRRALAVWITRGEALTPLQATGGWLD